MREVVVVGFHQCHNRSFLVLSTTTKMVVVALETHTIFFPPFTPLPCGFFGTPFCSFWSSLLFFSLVSYCVVLT